MGRLRNLRCAPEKKMIFTRGDEKAASGGVAPQTTHQPADLLLAVRRRPRRGFDHGRCLVIRQFFNATLPSNNIAHLNGNVHQHDGQTRPEQIKEGSAP